MDMPAYETETCTRCGGSGHYSYNQITGTRCFKCNGNKVSLTKRGFAAAKFAKDLREIKIEDIQVGQRVYWGNGGKCTVTHIDGPKPMGVKVRVDGGEWADVMEITLHGSNGFTTSHQVGTILRKGWTPEMVAEVDEYQSKLTKSGKIMKKYKKGS